jgi:hypothetical protein
VSSSISALTTRKNSPSVRTYNGRDNTATTGRTTALTTPKMAATTSRVNSRSSRSPPPIEMPSKSHAAIASATAAVSTVSTSFMTES